MNTNHIQIAALCAYPTSAVKLVMILQQDSNHHLSTTISQLHSLASGSNASRVSTDAATTPTPIPIPRMRFQRGEPWETIREKKKFALPHRSRTSFNDPRLSRVRPGLRSFRERLGVAHCGANKRSVCACVCRDVFRESVSRKNKILIFRKKNINSYQPWKPVCKANLAISTCHNEGRLPGSREFGVIKRVWTRSSGRYSEIVDSRCGGWKCRGKWIVQ